MKTKFKKAVIPGDIRRLKAFDCRVFPKADLFQSQRVENFAFLVGPAVYLSRTWPGEGAEVDTSQGQWQATVGRFLTAPILEIEPTIE